MSEKQVRDAIAKWNEQTGPRTGDWCETTDGSVNRISHVDETSIRLADLEGRFSLGPDGRVGYSGGFLPGPPIAISSLEPLTKKERGVFKFFSPGEPPADLTENCRVFKQGKP